jgi:methylenetetrahydrofolate dehydrogenase (NADP+)/methenyltetrahydrofolate cyclohydrolase
MSAKNIDGRKIANEIKEGLKDRIQEQKAEGRVPGQATILVGDDPAAESYVRMKEKAAQKLDIMSQFHHLEEDTKEEELLNLIYDLNNDRDIDGILIQLPLPDHIDDKKVIESLDPTKDVDGFHPLNTGRLFSSQDKGIRFDPCTPLGVVELVDRKIDIDGKKAVIVGRSNIVGKPVAHMLLDKNATVTICHSHTKDLKSETLEADILIAAVGVPEFIKGDMVKEGATVIDVGINSVDGKLVGDVEFDSASKRAGLITPVPGGAGPMTIAMLMENTVRAREYHGV